MHVILLLAASFAADLDLSEYWRKVAIRLDSVLTLERSKTTQQKMAEDRIAAADADLNAEREKLRAACAAKKKELDESGPQPVCKEKK